MESINKILRILVYIILSILLVIFSIFIIYGFNFDNGIFQFLKDYLVILFISFLSILFIFNKNKASQKSYNILLLIIGIFLIWRKYVFYIDREIYLHSTFTQNILSISSMIDIVPLFLVYVSTICTYIVYAKKK